MIGTASAPVPLPPENTIVGKFPYPLPGLTSAMDCTPLFSMVTVAAAPVPSPVKTTVGVEV